MGKIKFNGIVSGRVKLDKNFKIGAQFVSGFPKRGVELVDLQRQFYSERDAKGNIIPASVDKTRTTKITFHGLNLGQLLRLRKDLKVGDIDLDEYQEEADNVLDFDVLVVGEDECNEFVNSNPELVKALEDGKIVDVNTDLCLKPVWPKNGGWPDLSCGFVSDDTLKFSEFKPDSLDKSVKSNVTK